MRSFLTLCVWSFQVDLFSKWLLLIPIHLEIHWSLVTVTMATKTISYYDSQGIVFRHTTDVSNAALVDVVLCRIFSVSENEAGIQVFCSLDK